MTSGYRDEDDDDFIYGAGAPESAPAPAKPQAAPVFEPQPVQPIQPLEDPLPPSSNFPTEENVTNGGDAEGSNQGEEMMDEEEEGEEEEEESDLEIIVEAEDKGKSQSGPSRDFRPPTGNRTASFDAPTTAVPGTGATPPPGPRAPHLTTEYTPTPRGEALTRKPLVQPSSQPQSLQKTSVTSEPRSTTPPLPVQDLSTLPPATAPPSHPPINPSEPGTIEGRSIFEVDMDALAEKPWRRPGSDVSDYFNYGFDEISWEAYCYRRRDLGEMANHLKGAVANFSGLPDEQIAALPPEVRAMVMTGATSLMGGGAIPHGMQQPQMMGVGGPGPMMHAHPHVHEMGMMGVMNGGDMQQAPGMMPGQEGDGIGGMQEGFQPGGPGAVAGPAQMMGMGPEYGMQDQNTLGMYQQNMDGSGTPGPGPGTGPGPGVSPGPATGPGAGAPVARGGFRGRPIGSPGMGMRGRGGFGRGRGRGGMFVQEGVPPPIPVRPASPLPPGVPTGPRNQNRYKDRDGNAPAVDGLDYGGTQGGSIDSDERGNGRKRRVSPSQDEVPGRSLKRR